MGFAHKNNYEADYEFFGYLLQFLLSQQSPVFIPHKIQYVQFDHLSRYPFIEGLLKGIDCKEDYRDSIQAKDVVADPIVALAYKFRRDVNKLLKMRRKRRAHNRRLYGADLLGVISERKFH